MHGANKFISADLGAGSSAPFRKVSQKDLSLFQDTLIQGKNLTTKSLTPFERQLILRGSNALLMTGASLAENPNQDLSDIVTTLTVGLSFPVGKSPKEFKFREYIPPTPPEKDQLQLAPASRIPIGLTPTPLFGDKNLPIMENQRGVPPVIYPSSESPNVSKYGESFDPFTYVGETEKGFQAKGQGVTLHLDLDTAALNLAELKRAYDDGSYVKKGAPMSENLARQKSVQNAITNLEQLIPIEVQEFFEKNEEVIRAALKTNGEASLT
jgi:hypothetical protein